MPFRQLPNSDATRFCALQACKTKADAIPAEQRPISPANYTLLGTTFTAFKLALGARGSSLGNQSLATSDLTNTMNIARQLISHFVQALNNAIDRHVFPASVRAFYQLDVNAARVPSLSSEADVLLWGSRLKDGEAARVAAGGMAIPFPVIGDVNAAYDDFDRARLAQSGQSEVQDANEEAVAALRPAVDLLIKDLWDEIEFAFRKQSPGSLRGKAREWGVVYATRPDEAPEPSTPPPAALPGPLQFTDFAANEPGKWTVEMAATGALLFNVWMKGPLDADYVLIAEHVPGPVFEKTGLAAGVYQVKAAGVNNTGTGPQSEPLALTVME